MGLRSKLGIEYKGMFFFALFYLVAGVANFVILGIYGFSLFHVALVAVLSLIAAYGLYRVQRWSLWVVVALFFIATTYDAFLLNAFWASYATILDVGSLFAVIALIAYLILTLVATIYVVARRKNLR